jgi:hypothetical protein
MLKMKDNVKSVFRYRRIFDKTIAQLISDEVWGSKPTTFNDPYDFNFSFNLREISIYLENKRISLKKISDTLKIPNINNDLNFNIALWSYENINNLLQQTMGVACFCEEVSNPMMWGHYADNSKGFAIEYDLEELVEELDTEYDNRMIELQRKTLQIHTKPKVKDYGMYMVEYADQKPDVTNFIINELDYWVSLIQIAEVDGVDYSKLFDPLLYMNNTFGNDDNVLSELLISVGKTKNKEWSYEKEWRMILAQHSESDDYFKMIKLKPKAIYLGEKISIANENVLRNILKNKDVKIYKMFSNPQGNLKLECVELKVK